MRYKIPHGTVQIKKAGQYTFYILHFSPKSEVGCKWFRAKGWRGISVKMPFYTKADADRYMKEVLCTIS